MGFNGDTFGMNYHDKEHKHKNEYRSTPPQQQTPTQNRHEPGCKPLQGNKSLPHVGTAQTGSWARM
jgi:hypothetical protein